MADGGTHRITHLGLCVADLERSVAFYRDAIGMVEVGRLHVADGISGPLLELADDVELDLVYLERDGLRLELLGYRTPSAIGDGRPRPMNLLGLTHLSIRVGSLEPLADRIVAAGGQVVDGTTVTFTGGNRGLMALDPDGTRIELIERARPT